MRRDRRRRPYDPTLSSVLFFLGVLALVISGRAFAQTAAGTFSTVFGQVQIQRAGVTIGAASGVGVNVGDRILTGASGHVVILLNDQSRLEIGPVSSIMLDQFTVTGGATSTHVSLFSGVLRSLVNSASGGAANYQVHTPNAVAAVRGTKFDTAYTENVIRPGYQGCDRYTDVSVYQGTVNLAPIASPNTGEDVGAGYEATLPCDRPATAPGPLAMTGAVSLDSAAAGGHGLFASSMPGSSGAPPPACPVCEPVVAVGAVGGGGGSPPPPPPPPPPPGAPPL
jgi:FecR-like protein